MDKQQFLAHVEQAYDSKELKPESVFMFNLLEFEFSYDEENRECSIFCPISEPMLNPTGILHGGIATYIADTAMGHLNFRLKGAPYVTLDLNTSFLNAKATGKLLATARYVREGYKVSFMECIIEDENNDIVSKTTGTFYRYKK